MQREISDRIFLGETLNRYDDARRSTEQKHLDLRQNSFKL